MRRHLGGRNGVRRVLWGLLIVHLVWGLVRVPGVVFGRRWEEVAGYRERGAARFFLDTRFHDGAAAVERLLARTPEDVAVLWRGTYEGALELVPNLIAPRLMVAEDEVPAGATRFAGRPLAVDRLDDGTEGVLVLVGHGDRVELAVR